MSKPFYIVDVFAQEKYAGNQLAVVRGAASLTTQEMQRITREMNYSETTFILSDEKREGGFNVRIFAPGEELPFAGHPTLGTAFIIQQQIIKAQVPQVILNLQVGPIPVTFTYNSEGMPQELWMEQPHPSFGRCWAIAELAPVLGISPDQFDNRFPIEEVSTGLPFIIVPLKNLQAVKDCCIQSDGYLKLIEHSAAKSIFVFCPEAYSADNDLNARMFDAYHGIPEDPATGSANGCLAGYLIKHRYFGRDNVDLRVEQGYEIGRPSLLMLTAEQKGDEIKVCVGGNVILVARGELL